MIFFHPNSAVTALGGAEKRLIETLKNFCAKDRLEITILESTPSLLHDTKMRLIPHSVSPSFHGKGWLSTYLGWSAWIAKATFRNFSLARSKKPDVILVSNNTLPSLVSGHLARHIFHRPTCVIVHHLDSPLSSSNLNTHSLYNSYRKIGYARLVSLAKTTAFYITLPLLNKAEAIITVSNSTARVLKNTGIRSAKISVSGNAVDLKQISEAKPSSDSRIFDGVFVGRISAEKGIFDLLKIWRNIIRLRKDAKLLIVGSGLELPALKDRVSAYGLKNNVTIKGSCTDEELYGLLKSSRVFVFPSLFEGWGIAVAEALACGTPVVAYDIPALREVFGSCKSVCLLPVGDIGGMAQAVLKVLNCKNEKKTEDASAYAKRFEWSRVAEKDLEAIARAAETSSPKRF